MKNVAQLTLVLATTLISAACGPDYPTEINTPDGSISADAGSGPEHSGDNDNNTPDAGASSLDAGQESSTLAVSIAIDTPISRFVRNNSTHIPVFKIHTSAGQKEAVIKAFIFKRTGLGLNEDIVGAQLWGGDEYGIGKNASIDNTTGTLTFDGLNAPQQAGTTGSWTLFVDFKSKQSGGLHAFDLTEVILDDGGTVYGLPLKSVTFTIATSCAGPLLHVPADCPTIQSAVDAAQVATQMGQSPAPLTSILIAPGVYYENVKVRGAVNVLLTKDDGEVVIDGGTESAIKTFSTGKTQLSVRDIALKSEQAYTDYGSATIFAEFVDILDIQNVTVFTTSIGITTNYIGDTQVLNSTIIGDGGANTTGISWGHADMGSRVFYNTFQNLNTAVSRCSGFDPKLSPSTAIQTTTKTWSRRTTTTKAVRSKFPWLA